MLAVEAQAAFGALGEENQGAIALLRLVSRLQSCRSGVCCMKVVKLAARLGCCERTVRNRFTVLKSLGLAEKLSRRCRVSLRRATPLGLAVLRLVDGGRSISGGVAGHVAAHKLDKKRITKPSLVVGSAGPARCDPRKYQIPRKACALSQRAWGSLSRWLLTARSCSWARCKVAHNAAYGVVAAIHQSRDWRSYARSMAGRGRMLSAEDLVRLAIDDALRRGVTFVTVESAMRYVGSVCLACIKRRGLPGGGEKMPAGP